MTTMMLSRGGAVDKVLDGGDTTKCSMQRRGCLRARDMRGVHRAARKRRRRSLTWSGRPVRP